MGINGKDTPGSISLLTVSTGDDCRIGDFFESSHRIDFSVLKILSREIV